MKAEVRTFKHLRLEVLEKGLCTFCGACAASCPVFSIQPLNESFSLKGRCTLCGICYNQCPQTGFEEGVIEERIFGRRKKEAEEIGIYLDAYSVRSTREDIRKVSQDGGAVSSILAYALNEGIIDCSVTASRMGSSWKPWPKVSLKYEDILNSAGTKYTPSPTLLGLRSAVEEYRKERVGIVGTPCQVKSIRKMQIHPEGCLKLGDSAKLVIGLFCTESFQYNLLAKFMKEKGIDLTSVSKFDIKKGNLLVYAKEKEIKKFPLEELKGISRECCKYCTDFAAEFADISVGAVGSPLGWSTVIIRSSIGKEVFDGAVRSGYIEAKPIKDVKPGMKAIFKLNRMKKEKSERVQGRN